MYKAFLIKYAEIAIKGKNRYLFEDALVHNIEYQLKNVDGTFHVRKENGRIYVETEGSYDYDETVETYSGFLVLLEFVRLCCWKMRGLISWQRKLLHMWTKLMQTKILPLKLMQGVRERIIR